MMFVQGKSTSLVTIPSHRVGPMAAVFERLDWQASAAASSWLPAASDGCRQRGTAIGLLRLAGALLTLSELVSDTGTDDLVDRERHRKSRWLSQRLTTA